MRILHVSPYYQDAWAYGGIPRIVTALAQTLSDRGHEVTVCTTDACSRERRLRRADGQGRFAPFRVIDSHGVRVQVFPNLSNRLAYDLQLFLPRGLDAYLGAHASSFDVGHVHACHNLLSSLAARHLARVHVPFVLAPNGTAPRIERRQLAKFAFDVTLGRHVIPNAAALLAVSEAERRQLRDLKVANDQITVVPNPIDLSEFQTPVEPGAFRQRFGLGDAELVLFLGKLTPRKGVDVLARAFARLTRPGVRLVVVGNDMGFGPQLRRLIADLGLGQRTLMTGLLTGRARLEALADAGVVCYASKDEIFGLVPIEAILAGTPVIVANDSGCAEVIERVHGGLIVPHGDHLALSNSINAILDAPEKWRVVAREAAIRVRQWYATDVVCGQLEDLYRSVMPEAARRPYSHSNVTAGGNS